MARIIYVEDDDLMGAMVKEILTRAGHLIGVVTHGTLALETIIFKKPELVILDRNLPGMQGMEILKRLRQTPATYLTPILMLTGSRVETLSDEAMALGADDYLLKPFEPDDLVRRVGKAIKDKDFAANRKIR